MDPSTIRVLIVDDDRDITSLLSTLMHREGLTNMVAHDGETALQMVPVARPDMLLVDVKMPGIDGLTVLKRVKETDPHLPVVLITAYAEISASVAAMRAGAFDYLAKPFAFVELLARIKALARRPKKNINTVLKAESLTLDTNNYQVKRNNKNINLSKKEFALLEFLMRHPNQVFNAEQLTQQVWDYDSDVLPNTAQVYVGYLRKKIDKAFSGQPKLINNIRGFGYKLCLLKQD